MELPETIAPVIEMSSVRMFFALVSLLRLILLHGDMPSAKGLLRELIYMNPPPQMKVSVGKFLKLLKTLYGLNQCLYMLGHHDLLRALDVDSIAFHLVVVPEKDAVLALLASAHGLALRVHGHLLSPLHHRAQGWSVS